MKAWYTVDDDHYLTRVYIKSAKDAADFADHLFVDTKSYYQVAGTDTWKIDVVINGEVETISTTKAIAQKLAANKGKLFHVEYDKEAAEGFYGFVKSVELVNEATDIKVYTHTNENFWCNYAVEPTLDGMTIVDQYDGKAYKITADTKLIGVDDVEALEDVIDEGEKGIWITAEEGKNDDLAVCIYVGEKLRDPSLTAVKIDGVAATFDAETKTWTANVSYAELVDTTDKWMELTADRTVTVMYNGSEWTGADNKEDVNKVWAGQTYEWTAVVVGENGLTAKYTIVGNFAAAPAPVFAGKFVSAVMDSASGAKIRVGVTKDGETLDLTPYGDKVPVVKTVTLKIYDEAGNEVYTTDNAKSQLHNYNTELEVLGEHTMTAGAKYYAVVTLTGATEAGEEFSVTIKTPLIEAQTAAKGPETN